MVQGLSIFKVPDRGSTSTYQSPSFRRLHDAPETVPSVYANGLTFSKKWLPIMHHVLAKCKCVKITAHWLGV